MILYKDVTFRTLNILKFKIDTNYIKYTNTVGEMNKMPYGLGIPELLLIFGVILILFGPKKLPELARALGKAKREYEEALTEPKPKKSAEEESTEVKKEKSEEETLLETAKKLGIETEGKTMEEIADEIMKRVKAKT